MSVLELKNVFCGYGRRDVVKGISLRVNDGEIVSLAGPNGCGKTTLLRAACGLLPIRAGEVCIDGRAVSGIPIKERARLTAMLSQTGAGGDYSDYTVMDTVLMGRYARSKGGIFSESSEEDKEIAVKCICEVGLSGSEDRLITELSGGQLQRVFLARAFAQEPEIIFLDEPANHLDLVHQAELMELLRSWAERGKSVVGVFHDLGFAAAVSDRIVLISDGREVMNGDPEAVLGSERLNEVFGTDVKAYMKMAAGVWFK